ncbi:MAG: GDSL-type esterase/lipase family protein [Pseudomonadota bacterium]
MSTRALLGACCLLLTGCLLQPVAVEREANTLYLLPLGDSITQADRAHTSYRYPLWSHLVSRGVNVDFVGSRKRHHTGLGPATAAVNGQTFDRDHEGHWGWRADEVLAKLPTWLAHYPVDVALVHLGTNDVLQGQDTDETLRELTGIVTALRARNPSVTVLLGQPGQSRWANATALPALAEGVARLSRELDDPRSRVVAVPLHTRLTPEKTYDGLHPDAAGEAALAAGWLAALDALNLL